MRYTYNLYARSRPTLDILYGWNVGHCREYYFCMLLLLLLHAAAIVATNTEMSPMFKYIHINDSSSSYFAVTF